MPPDATRVLAYATEDRPVPIRYIVAVVAVVVAVTGGGLRTYFWWQDRTAWVPVAVVGIGIGGNDPAASAASYQLSAVLDKAGIKRGPGVTSMGVQTVCVRQHQAADARRLIGDQRHRDPTFAAKVGLAQ